MRPATILLSTLAVWAGVAPAVPAQPAAGNARAAGMADAYGALARGAAAVAYNPATLGLGTPARLDLLLPAARLGYGTTPVSLREIGRYGGRVVPPEVKRNWLTAISDAGAFRGTVQADLQVAGASWHRVAVTTGAMGQATMTMPRAAAELLLFGNTEVHETFTGGSGRYFAVSFVSVSAGAPLFRWPHGGTIAVGGSLKYLRGHAFGALWDLRGDVDGQSGYTDLHFPAVTVDGGGHRGVGLDVGVVWERGRLTLGAAIADLVNRFGWNTDRARLRDGRALLSDDEITVELDDRPLDDPLLPPALVEEARERLTGAVFHPVARLSSAYRWPRAVLTAELIHRSGGEASLRAEPPLQLAVGFEHHPRSFLRLRAGGSLTGEGAGGTLGVGLLLGPVTLDAAFGRRAAESGTASLLALGLGVTL